MVVFQSITYNRFRTVLTGAALLLFPAAVALAQTPADEPLPNPRIQPSVESYSLPPGPSATPEVNILQGPVDPDIPLARPPVARPPVAQPRAAPAQTPAQSGGSAVDPDSVESRNSPTQQPASQAPLRPQATEKLSPPETKPQTANPAAATVEPLETTGALATSADHNPSPPKAVTDRISTPNRNDWYLLLIGVLFFVLLGAMFLWQARRTSAKQSDIPEADRAETGLADNLAILPEPVQPAPAIAIGFRPHSANATLFNAVLGFELTLSNHGDEILTGIRVQGAMDQAGEDPTRDPALTDLATFREIPALQTGDTEKFVAEIRIPLASIRPIVFRSQALFVPQVQISIEFTDGAGFRHFQTAAYLVGQEHQPPRQKMAPFRLDTGPRSFAPLGHRLLAAG